MASAGAARARGPARSLLDGTAGDGPGSATGTVDLDPAGLASRGGGNEHVQDTVCVLGGEALGSADALAEGKLPGERPLGSLGDNDVLALAVTGGALGPDRQGA